MMDGMFKFLMCMSLAGIDRWGIYDTVGNNNSRIANLYSGVCRRKSKLCRTGRNL